MGSFTDYYSLRTIIQRLIDYLQLDSIQITCFNDKDIESSNNLINLKIWAFEINVVLIGELAILLDVNSQCVRVKAVIKHHH